MYPKTIFWEKESNINDDVYFGKESNGKQSLWKCFRYVIKCYEKELKNEEWQDCDVMFMWWERMKWWSMTSMKKEKKDEWKNENEEMNAWMF